MADRQSPDKGPGRKEFISKSGDVSVTLAPTGEGWAFAVKSAATGELMGNGHYNLRKDSAKIDWMHIFPEHQKALLPRKVYRAIQAHHGVGVVEGFQARRGRVTRFPQRAH